MRIVTWNCNGALRKKWSAIESLGADIFVIQECENPINSLELSYRNWAKNALWTGQNQHKGLGVFVRSELTLSLDELSPSPFRHFLSCRVAGSPLLAVWAMGANGSRDGYIGQVWGVLQRHRNFLMDQKALLIGDLNSNAQWDKKRPKGNHTGVVLQLSEIGLRSLYHEHKKIAHGGEPDPTFYMQRKITRPYHIDYAFAGPAWRLQNIEIGAARDWLSLSDHMPLCFDICLQQ